MTIQTIDKPAARTISEKAMDALEVVAQELGLSVEYGGGKYDPTAGTFTPKFTFQVEGGKEAAFQRDAGALWQHEWLTGEDYGATFKSQGRDYTLAGINLRAPKYPLLADCAQDGKTYRFTAEAVKQALGR